MRERETPTPVNPGEQWPGPPPALGDDVLDQANRRTGSYKAQNDAMAELSRSVRTLTIAHVVVSIVFLVVALVGGVLGYRFADGIERRLQRLEARP